MKLSLSTQLLIRTPAYHTTQTLQETFEDLKRKIAESSPIFHALIKDLHYEDLEHQTQKIQYTIWKYFNRAQHRPTPFGTFAAITLLPINRHQKPPILQSQITTHRWTDWKQTQNIPEPTLSPSTRLLTNSSVYTVAEQIRYLHSQNGKFELATINSSPAIQTILEACKTKCTAQSLYTTLAETHHLHKASANTLINQLLDLQLLHSEVQPNITGTDYFQRLNISTPASPADYVISQRNLQSGSFDGSSLKHLPAWIDFYTNYIQPAPHSTPELAKFIQDFQQRYQGRQIPLTQLMDPELGLGYGNFEQTPASSQSPITPNRPDHPTHQEVNHHRPNSFNTKFNQMLLQKLISGGVIDLSELPVDQAEQTRKQRQKKPVTLPNTLSAVFHRYQDQVVLTALGGATATAILGRFTPCCKAIESYARELAEIEQKASPDIIFFDIAYQSEAAVDNINRRKQLYSYELPLLCWSDHPHPLRLNDILVTIEGGQVILLCKTLGKRLIPRIPSAYNYLRSSLPVYRFLCDIQSQDLHVDFHFSLNNLFPGLSHYPRVTYKNLIVSPASYLVPHTAQLSPESLADWLANQQLNQPLKAGHADQHLYFDPSSEKDVWALWHYSKQQKGGCYLTEALLSEESRLADPQANAYSAQYIASFYHTQQIYQGVDIEVQPSPEQHPVGSHWLYAKFYCHHLYGNELLSTHLQRVINKYAKSITKWFFVRYNDPMPHIRLRLHLKKIADWPELLLCLNENLQVPIQNGRVGEFSLHAYQPELHRYGALRMQTVETLFALDSKYVLRMISSITDQQLLQRAALSHIRNCCAIAFQSPAAQLGFAKKMFGHFAREFQLGPLDFKKLNTAFRIFSQSPQDQQQDAFKAPGKKWMETLRRLISQCEHTTLKERMLADLIHMHVNRLFTTEQRWQEAVLYHHLQVILIHAQPKDHPQKEHRTSKD
ncbi:MAG: hypothetical protein EOO90_03755 [Pedobacter sp.]|nr:MAG: hypothetical protein EOO90_03755 [Pedobacter sp.]